MSPYVSFTHWGRDKRWTIPKAYHVARAKWCDAKKRGVEKPRVTVTDQFGNPFYDWNGNALAFQYWRHFTSRRYSSSHVERALNGQETHYYTSYHGYGRRLVYLDIDAHNQCQKPHLPQAIEFLNRLLKGAFGRKGEGGHNQWIKLKDVPNRDYNEALSRLERAIVALAEKDGQVCSFEVKGKSVTNSIKTFDDTRCHLAKLPYHNHDGRQWSWEMLEEWNDKPDVPWTRFVQWIKELEFLAYGEGEVPSADVDVMTGEVEERVPVELPSFPAGMSLDDIRDIPDAWIRDGLFAKWAARQNQQPLTAEQLLMLDREHEIYHGEWADGLGERMRRYKAIAPHVARGFDSAKCGKPSQRPRLDAALTKWRSRLLPSVSIGYHSGRRMTVMRRVLIGLLAIIETASQNNGDCPRDSIEGWWKELSDDDLMP
ncbi:MAG: hypothetical protein KDA52_22165, partial [Planctomycetaceae bacterium]|nr:hypothetical protein [Planctomycetaceae bacterium]